MNTPDPVRARRDAILAAASEQMRRAHAQRVRSARITSIAAVLSLGAIAVTLIPQEPSRRERAHEYVIDFKSVGAQTPTIDFAIDMASTSASTRVIDFALADSSTTISLEILTDAEAEQSLLESGYCVKIFRVRNQPVLVECSTGAPADFGESRSFIR